MLELSIGELFVRCVQIYAPIAPLPQNYKGKIELWPEDRAVSSASLFLLACHVPDVILCDKSREFDNGIAGVAVEFVESFSGVWWGRAQSEDVWFESWGLPVSPSNLV